MSHLHAEDMLHKARVLCPPGYDIVELRARGNRHWLIPIGSPGVRWNSLTLYAPIRWTGWAYRALAQAWLVLGKGRFMRQLTHDPTSAWLLGDLLLPDMPTLSTAAVYVGHPGPTQKIVFQLMNNQGNILGYAKYADNPHTRSLLANEARLLKAIPENVGPRLIRFTPFLDGELIVQTLVPGRVRVPRSQQLYEGHMRFLERLVKPGAVYPASEHPFVRSLYAQSGERKSMLERTVANLKDSEWPTAYMHGDLSPWNMRWWHGDYSALDWEHGRLTGLGYVEAPHPLIQFAGLAQKADPRRAKRVISDLLRTRLLPDRYKNWAPEIASLSALNMLISWYPPSRLEAYGPDPYESWLTTFVKAPGDRR